MVDTYRVSQHYCRKAYPVINNIENLMRKLIFEFMIKNLGSDWMDRTIPEELKAKLREKAGDIRENCLYESDFIQLILFMFKPYSEISTIGNLYKKIEEVEDLADVKALVPKSNWDRYFSDLIAFENLEDTWGELYELRNRVAHNKLLSRTDFEEVERLTEKIESPLLEAIDKIGEIDVPEKDKETIGMAAVSGATSVVTTGTSGFKNFLSDVNTAKSVIGETQDLSSAALIRTFDGDSQAVFNSSLDSLSGIGEGSDVLTVIPKKPSQFFRPDDGEGI